MKKELILLELVAMKRFSNMLYKKSYLYNNNKHIRENFFLQSKWLDELIFMLEKNEMIIKK